MGSDIERIVQTVCMPEEIIIIVAKKFVPIFLALNCSRNLYYMHNLFIVYCTSYCFIVNEILFKGMQTMIDLWCPVSAHFFCWSC